MIVVTPARMIVAAHTTCLWFDNNAEEAIDFYLAIFKDAKLLNATRCGEHGPGPKGSMLAASFQLEGQEFSVINGGPMFKLSEAVSLVVHCTTQAEVDALWDKLGSGGTNQQCGWLKDRFGLSWQIIPTVLIELLQDPDPAKAGRVMQAMLQMKKIDIAALRQAYEQH
jgi:predicted 3-demethylubiquinone-9 3-methyltransferase (glyoxalase superfamily)